MNQDYVLRATARDSRVRIFTCITTDLVTEMQRRHGTWPVATAALGRVASISSMMAMMLKNEERLTVKVDGDGPLGQIWVDAWPSGDIRGYVDQPHVDLPANEMGKLDVGGGVGRGELYVIRDTGLGDYYTSGSELQSGEIADDFTYYFVNSEQVPSAVGAGVLVGTDDAPIIAGGFLIQLMPGHSMEDIRYVEEQISMIPSVTQFLSEHPTAEALLLALCPAATLHHMSTLQFRCRCSYRRLSRVLLSLGQSELSSIKAEMGHAELTCHFCGNVYDFTDADLAHLIVEAEALSPVGIER